MKAQKNAPAGEKATESVALVPDGRWFQLRKESFSEAKLVEVVVREGKVVETNESVDLSRIQLGKLVRRVGESFGEKLE